ncbi:hypothetical protein BY458DRAFT_516658 [Sporodiniella umbellata]|nr:hypothetical protein BY458DRAFT_516658 [Sporodiniella umbellata]
MKSLFLFFTVGCVFGYCVENKGSRSFLKLKQTSLNAGYDKWANKFFYRFGIQPGTEVCCPWDAHECCNSGKREDKIGLILYTLTLDGQGSMGVDFELPCDGRLGVNGDTLGQMDIQAFDADHTPLHLPIHTRFNKV